MICFQFDTSLAPISLTIIAVLKILVWGRSKEIDYGVDTFIC